MSIKKILILAAAGVASSTALAGGPVKYTTAPAVAATPTSASNSRGVYIEGMGGYNQYAFKNGYGDTFMPTIDDPGYESLGWKHGSGNLGFGAAVGYQIDQYFAAELGGIYTLQAKYNYQLERVYPAEGYTFKFKPWYAYLAGKVSVPVYDNISVFAKLGAGYQKVKIDSDNADVSTSRSNWAPMFGAGVAYNITPAIYVDGQWLRFTGKIKDGVVQTTAPNMFLLGVGYKFVM